MSTSKQYLKKKQFSVSIGVLQYFIMYILKINQNFIIIKFVQTDLTILSENTIIVSICNKENPKILIWLLNEKLSFFKMLKLDCC